MSTEYSDQIKAQALAALLAGQSVSEVARMFGVPLGTLKSWKQRNPDATDRSVFVDAVDASDASIKRAKIGALLMDYSIASLETLIAQQRVFREYEWLQKQSAADAAILHGVSFDKVIRLLESLTEEEPRGNPNDAD